jgi:ATP-dependent Lhr-like helicase
MKAEESLASFHPLVREWFARRYGRPTAVQAQAWPAIASGRHVLALAPTGSGKTLTAFLGAISRIASGELPPDLLSVLYVSPLKALGEDVRRNLETPLSELASLFASRGASWPDIRAATRSGDTSQADRRRMLRRPPSILATTPESLALMLDSASSRAMLQSVRLVVLDEIHALAGDKRGALLACSVGRLALLAGEFQRVALSATARPVEVLADFVGGRRLAYGEGGRASYERREVSVIAPASEKRIELRVEWPDPAIGAATAEAALATGTRVSGTAPRYAGIIDAIESKMDEAGADGQGGLGGDTPRRGLLVFTDSRRRAERMAFLINEGKGEGAAWAHHGSLSREARRIVEERFKAGQLSCVVATASLELGIDVGSVSEVVLAGTPGTVASTLQRIGRSGHGVGEVSRGTLYPFHGMDLVLAAAAAKGVDDRAVEETRPLSCPLDVLAQVLLELTLEAELSAPIPRKVDALYDIVLSFPPFEKLPRSLFDSTLQMLAGKYSGTRLRELEPRITIDAASGTATAGKAARSILVSSGGTIPDRGLYSMRVAGSKTRIGELDEEFVFERKVGEVFSLGAQAWRITEIGSEAVMVVPAEPDLDIVPFWKGEAVFRGSELSSRSLELLDKLCDLDEEAGAELLKREYRFSDSAAAACSRFVGAQKTASASHLAPSLPGAKRIVLEEHEESGSHEEFRRLVLHTLRGLAVNEPLALAVAAALEEDCGLPVRRMADDDLILFAVPRVERFDPAASLVRALRGLAEPGKIEALVRSSLEGSGIFGAQFRQNAGRAMLLPRGLPGKRNPLWLTRLRAKKLFEAVKGRDDFPIIVETWRSCLSDLFDLEGARLLASQVAEGRVEIVSFSSRVPSPFAREALWKEVGDNMYRTDELSSRASSSVSDRIIEEALRTGRLRPRLEASLVKDFEARLKRLVPGWAPEDCPSLAEWARERVFIPASELPAIAAASGGALGAALEADPSCAGRLVRLRLPGASEEVLVHAERVAALSADPASHIAEWLRREGAVSRRRIASLFGLSDESLGAALDELEEAGTIVVDLLVEGLSPEDSAAEGLVVDAQNLEIMLRRSRAAARPSVKPRPAEDLARLVFGIQGIHRAASAARADGAARAADLERALIPLSGCALPAELWETDILGARIARYAPADLDALLASSPWQWFGSGSKLLSFAMVPDLELFLSRQGKAGRGSSLLPPSGEAMEFWALRERTGLRSTEIARALWAEAWKGRVASNSFRDVREGIANRFGLDMPDASGGEGGSGDEKGRGLPFGAPRRIPRALKERWRSGAPLSGSWFALDLEGGDADEDSEEEENDLLASIGLDAARARALASRYGILCRSILEREPEGLRWGDLFPAMRRLELAGELLGGRFFEGLEGPQFLDPAAFPAYLALDESAISGPAWVNVLDPAASALYALAEKPPLLPSRVPANRACMDGGRLIAASTRSYRDLSLAIGPGDPRLPAVFSLFQAARGRAERPERRIVVEAIDGNPAAGSPFAAALAEAGFEADRGKMVLW